MSLFVARKEKTNADPRFKWDILLFGSRYDPESRVIFLSASLWNTKKYAHVRYFGCCRDGRQMNCHFSSKKQMHQMTALGSMNQVVLKGQPWNWTLV
jgi:hypothetical protein